jgi:hypothetical protein
MPSTPLVLTLFCVLFFAQSTHGFWPHVPGGPVNRAMQCGVASNQGYLRVQESDVGMPHPNHLKMGYSAQKVLAATFAAQASAVGLCPIPGAVFPAPQNLSASATFREAQANITSVLNVAFRTGNSSRGPIVDSDTYALQVFTASEENVFEYYHRGSGLVESVGEVNGDSIYLIASVTKMLTVYVLLLEAGYEVFSDSITKYLPELAGVGTWDQTTVGAIAGQTGGVVADREYSRILI